MKKTFAGALFVALGATTVGAGALSDISLAGSDTLKPLTIAVINACPQANVAPGGGLTYAGGGSGAGEGAIRAATQQVAPMSRFLAAANTCAFAPDAKEAEALQVGLDALSVVTHSSHRAACDPDSPPVGAACTKDVPTGIRYSDAAPSVALACGMVVNDWRAVLRMIYFGLAPIDVGACSVTGTTSCFNNGMCPAGETCTIPKNILVSDRNCSDPCRTELVNNWGKLFQNACSGGDCTQLQHAFRRDENSGTTDAFRDLIQVRDLAAVPALADGNQGMPFCNEMDTTVPDAAPGCPPPVVAGAVLGAPGLPARPYFELYQDADPIRRPAIGNGDLALDLATPPSAAPTEQVASAQPGAGNVGTLGLVIPVSIPPITATVTDAERHARIGTVLRGAVTVPTQYCTRGFFKNGNAPQIAVGAPAGTTCPAGPTYSLCPNGDVPKAACWDEALKVAVGGTGVCPLPIFDADAQASTINDQDFRCINGRNNRPTISGGVNQMAAPTRAACVFNGFDGRVYNLHPHLNNGQYVTQAYSYNGPIAGIPATGQRPVVGAFYRMHETRTAVPNSGRCSVTTATSCTVTADCPAGEVCRQCVGDACCASANDSTDHIGCLVGASPCSIGFAGENSTNQEVPTIGGPQTVYGSSLDGVEPATQCVLANSYPFSRFLYISTMIGFRDPLVGVNGEELGLASCYSDQSNAGGSLTPAALTIQQLVAAELFQSIPVGCKNFDESVAACADGGPTNSCANNNAAVDPVFVISPIPSALAIGEPCAVNADCATNNCTALKCVR